MLAAAKDIVRQANDGLDALDPLTVQWARDVVAFNPARVLAPSQAKVLSAFEADPMKGLSVPQIREHTGIMGPALLTIMTLMKNAGLVFQLFQWGRSRYFASQAALEAGRPAFEADELAFRARRTVIKERPQVFTYDKPPVPRLPPMPRPKYVALPKPAPTPKPPKPPKEPKPPKVPKPKKINLERAKNQAFNPTVVIPKPTVLHSGKAFVPDHVQVQKIPTSLDTRFTVDPATIKGGFADEWQRARKVGHLRKEGEGS